MTQREQETSDWKYVESIKKNVFMLNNILTIKGIVN